jgi:hypothetical protein
MRESNSLTNKCHRTVLNPRAVRSHSFVRETLDALTIVSLNNDSGSVHVIQYSGFRVARGAQAHGGHRQ